MKLWGDDDFGFSSPTAAETPCPPAELPVLPPHSLSKVLLLLSVGEQERGHGVGNVISELPVWEK